MRCVPVLVVMVSLTITAPVGALGRMLPQPLAEPLGALVRNSKTIHILKVKSVDAKGVIFETATTLKGKPTEAPFGLLKHEGEKEGTLKVGILALCFVQGDATKRDGNAVALLHIGTRWVVGVSPDPIDDDDHWFTFTSSRSNFSLTYDGTDEALREHVAAILTGRETTITSRAPQAWDARGSARLWRIKASLNITNFVLSDESPHFVGWGTGEPDEVPTLMDALSDSAPRNRIQAAADLAHLGKAAREALPTLRGMLLDPDADVALAAAKAVAWLDADDYEAVEAIRSRLRHADADQRSAAAYALADLGPRARAALPTLRRSLRDENILVRYIAAEAVGQVAPDSPSVPEAVSALVAMLEDEKQDCVRGTAIRSLRCFGPHAWVAMPALRESTMQEGQIRGWYPPDVEAVALLARFNPPPVELLAEILTERRSTVAARRKAAEQLGALGPRARAALPALRWLLQEPQEGGDDTLKLLRLDIAQALLDIDPVGAPAEVVLPLCALAKEPFHERHQALRLLGRCGASAKPLLPELLAALDTKDRETWYAVAPLTPLFSSENRKLLPELRLRFETDDPKLPEALLRLGCREEALAEVTKWLENDNPYCRERAIRWLRQWPREAKAAAPALRQAQAKASGGERVRLALTLWRMHGAAENSPRTRALTGLDNLLAACDGDSAIIGYLSESAFWSAGGPWGRGHTDALGAAIDEVYCRVQAGDPVAVLTRLLRDKDVDLRLAAIAALAQADPNHPDLIPTLRHLLERHPNCFCYTADTLAALGPRAAPLALLLLPNLRHPDESVYRVTDRVLRRIDPVLAAKGWGAADVPGAVPMDLGPLWEDLADKDAYRADLAAWRLAGAGPRAVALLRERLRPPPTLTPERVARLIADLDNDVFATRERASAELAAGFESAALDIQEALGHEPSPETRCRLEELFAGLDSASKAEQQRRLRGVRLLEAMGNSEARELLQNLSRGDPRFRLTREAAAALRSAPSMASPNSGIGRVPRRVDPKRARSLARS